MERRVYTCDVCEKAFPHRGHLWEHRRNVHVNPGAIRCVSCNETFTTLTHKRRYDNVVHLGEKKYVCNHCDRKCSSRCSLLGHIRGQHHGGKLICTRCSASFSYKHTLTNHLKRCGKPDAEPFACNKCPMIYTTNRALKLHVKCKHSGVKSMCEVCRQVFDHPSSYKRHLSRKHQA
jgi:uncharacterized Zn-finger protein